jgi:hypothetical protein
MRGKKILVLSLILMMAASIPLAFANGVPHDYISKLWAGRKHYEVGLVLVDWMDEDTIRVTYETKEGCCLLETHLAVVTDPDDFPMTKSGNPKIGLFPYADYHDPPATEVTYYVDIEGEGPFYIAAHAVVCCGCKCETAWGQGDYMEFPGNSWAIYFIFDVQPPMPI